MAVPIAPSRGRGKTADSLGVDANSHENGGRYVRKTDGGLVAVPGFPSSDENGRATPPSEPVCRADCRLSQCWEGGPLIAAATVRQADMKINQNMRHFASRKALEVPVIKSIANRALVNLHTKIFLRKADPDHRDERRDHLHDFFDATMDTYLAALLEGYTEAEAREITHIQANFNFLNRGWTEMMEFPFEEAEEHYERYADFFERHGITIDDPLGEFRPSGGIADAPSTPEKLDDPEHPHAEGGFADDVYVDTGDEIIVGGQDEPEDVDVTDAPGVSADDTEDGTA